MPDTNKVELALAKIRQIRDEHALPVVGSVDEYTILVSLRAFLDCRKQPCWLKAAEGRMVYLNPAYTEIFGKTLVDYIGEKDNKEWGEVVGAHFDGNDKKAIQNGKEVEVVEQIPMPNGEIVAHMIRKWPVYLKGELIGVAGESLGIANE